MLARCAEIQDRAQKAQNFHDVTLKLTHSLLSRDENLDKEVKMEFEETSLASVGFPEKEKDQWIDKEKNLFFQLSQEVVPRPKPVVKSRPGRDAVKLQTRKLSGSWKMSLRELYEAQNLNKSLPANIKTVHFEIFVIIWRVYVRFFF